MIWRLQGTYETHSGYVLPYSLNGFATKYHDFHHTNNTGQFGGSDFWDNIFGTNKYFQE